MALTQQQANTISRAAQAAKAVLDLRETLAELDVNWDGVPNYHAAITQPDSDAVQSFGGITVSELGEGMYNLKQVLLALDAGLVPLIILKGLV